MGTSTGSRWTKFDTRRVDPCSMGAIALSGLAAGMLAALRRR